MTIMMIQLKEVQTMTDAELNSKLEEILDEEISKENIDLVI
jgi:hypothetical protein